MKTNSVAKKLLSILILLLSFNFLFAFEYGGDFDSTTSADAVKFIDPDFVLSNSERLTLWTKVPLNSDFSSYFTAEGFYDFVFRNQFGTVQNSIMRHNLDLSIFMFGIKLPTKKVSSFINVGRFLSSDLTGHIFNQPLDGLLYDVNFGRIDLSVLGGYTGLLNSNSVGFYNSPYKPEKGIYPLAQKNFIGSVRSTFNIFNNQFLGLEFFTSADLGGLDYHKMYGTLSFNGTIAQSVFYVAQSSLGMALKADGSDKLQLSNFSRAELSWYPDFLNSSLTANVLFASGDSETLKAFQPVTSMTISNIGNYISSIIKTGLRFSIKPTSQILLFASGDLLCGFDKNQITMNGVQWGLNGRWQIVSDVYISMDGGQYISLIDNSNYFLCSFKFGFSF